MQKQPAYLYNNVQELYTDLDPKWMGYRKVYARTLKLYKGIDNSFTVKLMNGDQKLLDVDNVEYKERRAEALKKPNAVVVQYTLR